MPDTSLHNFINLSRQLPTVPLQAVQEYHTKLIPLIEQVDTRLTAIEQITSLIGHNPLQMMYDNHKHHGYFMSTVFGVNGFELLARTLPWVYRAYSSHGFQYEYFQIELEAWKKAISSNLDESAQKEILEIYDWMIDKHDSIITLSKTNSDPIPIPEQWFEIKNSFMDALLDGDHRQCQNLAEQYLQETDSLKSFYMHIIQPAMYEIGQMWERAEISVAQEHLASAVVSRVVAGMSNPPPPPTKIKGRALITSAEGELHELGAWIVSDLFQYAGWEIRYLGANTPSVDLLELMESYLPNVLAISVTMPFNVMRVKKLINDIRKQKIHHSLKIMVGGRVFIDNPELRNSIGADSFASNVDEAGHQIDAWSNSV